MLELQTVRVTEKQIVEVFCLEIFKGPENLSELAKVDFHEFELDRVDCVLLLIFIAPSEHRDRYFAIPVLRNSYPHIHVLMYVPWYAF